MGTTHPGNKELSDRLLRTPPLVTAADSQEDHKMTKKSIVIMHGNVPIRMTGGNDYLQGTPFTRVDYGGMRTWYRDDTWMIDNLKTRVTVTGKNDSSPIHSIHDNYNFDCACCYLGHTHSVDYHNRRITR